MKNREELVELIKALFDNEAGGYSIFRGTGIYTISEEHLDNAANDIVDEIFDILDDFVEYERFMIFGKYVEIQEQDLNEYKDGACSALIELHDYQLNQYLKEYIKGGKTK